MPTLHWIGKEKVVNHHREVPFKVLEKTYDYNLQEGKEPSGNKIIHGDNLEALKSLLPEYEGKVNCIYIDPPYNTGNENWVYNDNVNHPKIKKWLGEVVGKEGDDLTRHDKWLCMMYPRLKLLYKLLAKDGVIFISIDDAEQANLKLILDELFGRGCFVTSIIWEKADSPRNSARQFSTDHDFVLIYSKSLEWTPNRLGRTKESNSIYKNPDNDPRGPWLPGDPYANKPYSKGMYSIIGPTGREFGPPPGRYWRISNDKLLDLDKDGRIWWGPTKNARPSIKRYLNEVSDLVPRTLWTKKDVGSNRSSKNEIRLLFPHETSFDTPKPVKLIERVIELATDKESIVLDSFAGSGTTAHAVLNLNKQDGGNRKFILVEMEDYAENITAERVKRVIQGYGEGSKEVEGSSGDFSFYELGENLFDEDGNLNDKVSEENIIQYIWYSETRTPLGSIPAPGTYFLGMLEDTAYYFIYEKKELTTLDYDTLGEYIIEPATQYIIYADNCLLPQDLMNKHNIIFKKIPRDITRF